MAFCVCGCLCQLIAFAKFSGSSWPQSLNAYSKHKCVCVESRYGKTIFRLLPEVSESLMTFETLVGFLALRVAGIRGDSGST